MKKIFKGIGMVLFLFSIVTLATAGQGYLKQKNPEKIQEPVLNADKADWGAPDKEYLDYYGLGEFETKLPVVYIDTEEKQITKENKTWATVGILNNSSDGSMRNVMETPEEILDGTVNLRGASSYSLFDKEQYRLKFYKKQGSAKAEEYNFLGMAQSSEWVLHGPYLDKTMMRNCMVYEMAREMFEWSPDARYCEVFVNGQYKGVYLAVEPVTNGAGRLRLSEFGLLSGECAYVVKRERKGTEENPLSNWGKREGKTSNDLYISYPSEKKLTDAQRKWIEQDISRFENELFSSGFADPESGYAAYIDVDNFVDYFVLNEVVMNYDASSLSTYAYKEISGKLQLTVWDYNNCYDNYQGGKKETNKFYVAENTWFDRLLKDRKFVDRVVQRYYELRKSIMNTDYMYAQMAKYEQELGAAIDRNFAVWGYSFDRTLMSGDEREIQSYEAAVEQLKTVIEERFTFLDEHIVDLYENCI